MPKQFEIVPALPKEIIESESVDDVIKAYLGDIPREVLTSLRTGGVNVLPRIEWKLVRDAFSKMVTTKREAIRKSVEAEQILIKTHKVNTKLMIENEALKQRIEELEQELSATRETTFEDLNEIDADDDPPANQENNDIFEDMLEKTQQLQTAMEQAKLERDQFRRKSITTKEKLEKLKAWILLSQYTTKAKRFFYSKYLEFCQANRVQPEYLHMGQLVQDHAQKVTASNFLLNYNLPLETLELLESIKEKRNETAHPRLKQAGAAEIRAAAAIVLAPEDRERIYLCLTRFVV